MKDDYADKYLQQKILYYYQETLKRDMPRASEAKVPALKRVLGNKFAAREFGSLTDEEWKEAIKDAVQNTSSVGINDFRDSGQNFFINTDSGIGKKTRS